MCCLSKFLQDETFRDRVVTEWMSKEENRDDNDSKSGRMAQDRGIRPNLYDGAHDFDGDSLDS